MRRKTAALLFGAVTATGAAAIGAATATLLTADAAAHVDRTYQALAKAFFTMPSLEADLPTGQQAALRLVRTGPDS